MALSSLRRRQAAIALVLAGSAFVVSACGSSTAPAGPTPSASGSGASSAPASAAVYPTVAGGYGTKPTLTFPTQAPSSALAVKVLSEGKGAEVKKSDLVVVDYLGQVWKGATAFDNSYDRKEPLGTPIGVGQVITGWDTALVGKKVGSRVLMVVPPAEGYGTEGNTSAGIKGTDTLAFVVDIVNTYSVSVKGDTKAAVQPVSTGDVTVTGALGAEPKITVKKGAAIPTAATATVLAKSTGAPVKAGLVVLQYTAVYYSGGSAGSTFQLGYPFSVGVGATGSTSPFEKLVGVPIGSRVLLTTPYQDTSSSTTASASPTTVGLAIVADIIAQDGPAQPAK